MPSFLCCSTSAKSLPLSPDGASAAPHTLLSRKGLDSSPDSSSGRDTAQQPQHKQRIRLLLNDALLPGQLPDTGRGAARVHMVEPATKKGVPLLEDTLPDSKGSTACFHSSVGGSLGRPSPSAALDVPAQLLPSSSASFDADYRVGELTAAQASNSDFTHQLSGGSTIVGDAPAPAAVRAAPHRVDEVECLRQLLQTSLRRAVSRSSGHCRLYRHCLQAAPAQPHGMAADSASGAPAALNPEASAASRAVEEQRWQLRTPGEPPPQPYASVALHQLQRELRLATELPRCPLLLLPYRVYREPSVVHVVYDAAGEYTELHTVLQERQRLSERSCRSILKQLLQALAVLHESRWLHRNINTETVWVAEEPPQEGGLPPAPGQPPQHQQQQDAQEQRSAVGTGHSTEGPQCGVAAVARSGATRRGNAVAGEALGGPNPLESGALAGEGTLGTAAGGHAVVAGGGRQDPQAPGAAHDRQSAPGQTPADGKPPRRASPQILVKLGGLVHAAREPPDATAGGGCPFRELVGSAYHLAPEAVRGRGYGPAADIWAAGVLLYMMLTGRPPFPGRNELEVMTRILLVAAETEPAQPSPVARQPGADGPGVGPAGLSGPGWVTTSRRSGADTAGAGGASGKSICTVSSVGTEGPGRRKLADSLQEVVVKAVLESCASAACREALAAMLELEPARRMGAKELLLLPWFAKGEE